MGHAFALLFLVPAVVILLSLVFLDTLLRDMLKVSEAVFPYAKTYLQIILRMWKRSLVQGELK